MKNYKVFSIIMMACVMAIGLSSCKKDDPAPVPTVRFLTDINADNNYQVDITMESTDASSFEWNYGDGNVSIEAASHSYIYDAAGEYTITVKATGDGGTADHSETVTIVAPIEDPISYTDSISMGAGYANDVYYSLENGIISTAPRAGWDIAFSTNPMSSTVLINEGYGVMLYTYPHGDKDAWETMDTTGMAAWPAMYNADTSWLNGAFDRYATGHPDYGWGVYNSQTHDVIGDSLFVIKLNDGTLKKIFIEKRAAMSNSFTIKYGEIDGAGETKEINCNSYASRNFIYFSLTTGEVMDNEPDSELWDIVFTKYHDESIPYIVTGVLTNMGRESAEVRNTDTDQADPETAEFLSDISVIGSDWKEFDMGSFTYVVEEDLCYFVKSGDNTYKIIFTGTDGSASGKMVFKVEKQN